MWCCALYSVPFDKGATLDILFKVAAQICDRRIEESYGLVEHLLRCEPASERRLTGQVHLRKRQS